MDIKEYISSGVLENYILGLSSEQERKEVECMSHIYPEIKEELLKVETGLAEYAESQKEIPPSKVKEKLLLSIKNLEQEEPLAQMKVSPRKTTQAKVGLFSSPLSIAASFALIILFASLWLYNRQELGDANDLVASIKEEKNIVAATKVELERELELARETLKEKEYTAFILGHSKTKQVALAGTENSPGSVVRTFWNTVTQEIFLKVDDLPASGENQQYQLWALVDGTPQDMGVIALEFDQENVIKMPAKAAQADAFAITLEKEGGSPTPTLSNLFVIGNV